MESLGNLEIAVKKMQDYSYAFNIKILRVPELKVNEDATKTSNLCINLFNRMGANVTINDIDIAYSLFSRVFSLRAQSNHLQRRLMRNNVMVVRREALSVAAQDVGLEESQDMSKILILDHLMPRMQELYGNVKSFKTRFGFQLCWAKNGTIFLRRSEDSRPLKVHSPKNLSRIIQDEQEALSLVFV